LKHRVAFITGSATGLGRRIAQELAAQGAHVVVNYVNSKEKAIEFGSFLEETYGAETLLVQGDVSRYEDSQRMVRESFERFGQIDLLVNNAGPFIFKRISVVDYATDDWRYMVDGNLNSVFYLCKLIVPHMRERGFGRIVNIGFERAETAPAWVGYSAYAAAKAGLVSLTKTLAVEEAPRGITVNMVCPGDIVDHWKEADIAAARLVPDSNSPVGRMGTGEDIARVVAFLCDDKSDFVTGAVIPVTGANDVLSTR